MNSLNKEELMTDIVYPADATLPHPNGRLVARAQCLGEGDGHLWVVLAHYPDRGQWWATEGEWYCHLYNAASGCYVADIQESHHLRAIDLFTNRLKHYVRRYIDGSTTTEE